MFMRNERRNAGRGVRAAERLLDCIARAQRAHVKKTREGFVVQGGAIDGAITVLRSPTDYVQWRTRLEWLEKQAASFLLGAPLIYSARVRSIANHRITDRALRLSFGLSLSMGHPLRQRFAAYLFLPGGNTVLQIPNGESIEAARDVTFLALGPAREERVWDGLVPVIEEACEHYSKRDDVKEELSSLARKRREALWYLDNLYMRREGFNDHLYGLPPEGTSGSAAITQEYRNCQRVLLERYSVRIELTPLSLGILSP